MNTQTLLYRVQNNTRATHIKTHWVQCTHVQDVSWAKFKDFMGELLWAELDIMRSYPLLIAWHPPSGNPGSKFGGLTHFLCGTHRGTNPYPNLDPLSQNCLRAEPSTAKGSPQRLGTSTKLFPNVKLRSPERGKGSLHKFRQIKHSWDLASLLGSSDATRRWFHVGM